MAGLPFESTELSFFTGRRLPVATIGLIIVNVILYIVSSIENGLLTISDYWVQIGAYIPALVAANPIEIYRVFTSMFLHAHLAHIFFNMYYLYVFGKAVERVLGPWRFLALYFMSGLAASAMHTAFSALQGSSSFTIPALGASGAISGVLGAYLMLFPGTSLTTCWFFYWFPLCFTVRAWVYLVFWFALQVLYGYMSAYTSAGASVAFFAHAGGFIMGIALLPAVMERRIASMVKLRREFFVYLFDFIRVYRVSTGLSATAKVILLILIGAVLAGSLVVYTNTSILETYTIAMYDVNGLLKVYYTGMGVRPYHLIYSKNILYYVYVDIDRHRIGEILDDDVRVLMNRLYYSGLIYNPNVAGRELRDEKLDMRVNVAGIAVVPTSFIIEYAKYRENGWLEKFVGSVITYPVKGWRVDISQRFEYHIELDLLTADIARLVSVCALTSIAISLAAMYVVVAKDRDVAVVGEEIMV